MATLQDVCTFLKEAGTYHLATLDGDQPHVRPFGTAELFEGNSIFKRANQKRYLLRLLHIPR